MSLEKPLIRYAFEFETVGVPHLKVRSALQERLKPIRVENYTSRGPTHYWTTSTESGLGDSEPCETRSRVNPSDDEIRIAITTLKELGCYTTTTCGMHVHVSTFDGSPLRINLPPTEIWEPRQGYALNKTKNPHNDSKKYTRAHGVHQPSHDHIEVRLFNAFVDPDYVLANIKLVLNNLRFPALEDGPITNSWLSVPITLEDKKPGKIQIPRPPEPKPVTIPCA